jgi:signal transduction histidine kinase
MHPRRTVRVARFAGIFSLLITTPAIVGLIGDEPTVGRLVTVIASMLVFIVVFMHAVRGRAHPQPPAVVLRGYVLMLAIAGTLAIADRTDWGLLFYYAIALGGLRLPSPWNIVAVPDARADLARLAVADERERFARDLHDLLGHSLSVIALKAQLARRRLADDPDAALDDVADIETVSRDALREVREAVSGYRKPALDAELQGARAALDAAGIETTIDRPAVELPDEVEAVLAWTVREAATNVIRHSGARHSTIRLVPALDQASVEIVDDGGGLNGSDGGGTGLTGLQERLRQAGGHLEAGPRDDGPGFRVRAIVPVASAR